MSVSVRLRIDPSSQDTEDLAEFTARLQEELSGMDAVERVSLVSAGASPAGAKAGDAVTWGELLTTLAASGGVFTALIGVVQAWVGRTKAVRTVTIEMDGDRLELSGASSDAEQRLIEDWISRRRGA